MTLPLSDLDPAHLVSVAADIADAVDPGLELAVREAATASAVRRDPHAAVTICVALAQGLVECLAALDPDGGGGVMREIRQSLAGIPYDGQPAGHRGPAGESGTRWTAARPEGDR